MKLRLTTLLALVTLFVLGPDGVAMACPFCGGGDTGNSPMSKAAGWGIFAMVIIMFAMLGALVAGGFYLNYRAKHPLPDYQELLGNDDDGSKPNTSS